MAASMQDVAEKAGVSRATVSRVLSNHPSVTAATRKNVLNWVEKLGYEPNLIAQSLAGNSTSLIGVMVPEIAYPFFSEIIEAIENQAFYEGYNVIICNTRRNLEKERNILTELKQRKADGIIAVPVSVEQSAASYRRVNLPVTMITKRMEGFHSVFINHYDGGVQMAKHFLNVGFQKMGYIGPISRSISARKYAGFREYLLANQATVADVIECDPPENMNATQVYENVKKYAAVHGIQSEVFFANDDITACEAMAALTDLGYSIPRDIALAGFDNSLLAKEATPKLTSLAQPLEEIGKKAVEVLLGQIRQKTEPQLYELETRVVARASTINWKLPR